MRQRRFTSLNEPIEAWFNKKNKIHRNDGPAIIDKTDPNNIKYYWVLNGDLYSFEEWCKKTKKTNEEIVQMKLIYQGHFKDPTYQGNDI